MAVKGLILIVNAVGVAVRLRDGVMTMGVPTLIGGGASIAGYLFGGTDVTMFAIATVINVDI